MTTKSRLSNKIIPEGMSIEEWQVALRREQAEQASFAVAHLDDNRIWGDYSVSGGNAVYKVAFRGVRSDRNYCSCIDFRINGLGTCKHLEAVILFLRKNIPGYPWADMVFNPSYSSIYVRYRGGRQICMRVGEQYSREFSSLQKAYFDEEGVLPIKNYPYLGEICRKAEEISSTFRCYQDVPLLVSEVLRQEQWREELRNTYPTGRIPWLDEQEQEESQEIERTLYDACFKANGLLVGIYQPQLPTFVARLAEEVYLGEEHHEPGYVILKHHNEVERWRRIFHNTTSVAQLPIIILSADDFISQCNNNEIGSSTFIYIDEAMRLRDWKDSLSLAIKKIKSAHLYMRLSSLTQLGTVHVSSILQHINPFVIGPLYKFIHTYQPIFPIKDDGSNLPRELEACTIFLGNLGQRDRETRGSESLRAQPTTPEEKVAQLLYSLNEVIRDPLANKTLREMIQQLMPSAR